MPKTIASRTRFLAELRRSRAAGYAIAMCVVGPKERMTNRTLQDVRAPHATLSCRMSERLEGAFDG